MRTSKITKIAAIFAVTLGLVLSGPTSAVNAWQLDYHLDTFDKLVMRPNPGAYWWVSHYGPDENGQLSFAENVECAVGSCVKVVKDGFLNLNRFVRLELDEHPYAGVFTVAELSELKNGVAEPNVPGRWNPDPYHPVILNYRLRFSDVYRRDGTGDAVGSVGVWLWNNPFGQTEVDPFEIYSGFGFTWQQDEGLAAQGLNATLVRSTLPVYVAPAPAININDWNIYTVVWSEDTSGEQTISFFVNANYVGSTPMIGGSLEDLSLEIWVDNQKFEFDPVTGGANLVLEPIIEKQYVDIDYIFVTNT